MLDDQMKNFKKRIKLTKKVIDNLPSPPNGQVFLRDTEIPGFGLRLTPGSKTFILEKFIEGRSRRISIGPFGPLTLDVARDQALKMTADIISGKDPAQERIDKRRSPTFGDLITLYRERHASRKKSGANDLLTIGKHLSPWKNRKLTSIKRNEIALLHAEVGKDYPYQANRILALLSKMFNLAHVWGLCEKENPVFGIGRFKEEKRDRFVQPHELPRLMEALKAEPNFYIRAAFLLCLLTGQRKSEILSMKWADVNFDQGVWRIPETKPGRPHLLPLPTPAREILEKLPRMSESEWVFPGQAGNHLVNINKAWSRIKEKAKLQDVRIHDLRRTLGSYLAASGDSLIVIGKALGHTQPQTTAVYARLNLEPVRAALEANAQRMMLIADKAAEGNDEENKI